MAGGQGIRLRILFPKALKELDIPSKMTLLELNFRRIKKLLSLHRTQLGSLDIPVYILTSDSTHSPIAAFLMQHNNFGLPSVMLVKQRQLPARTPDGEFVLSEKWKIMAAPNGNGAFFQELKESGALADMKRRGVKYVEIHPIDNALAKPADPLFLGALMYEEGDAAIKVLKKTPKERIGTMCRRRGKTIVVEYSEIPAGDEEAYTLGNTGLQIYGVDLIERAASESLPYHIANKKEKLIDGAGEQVIGDVQKFERFVFDALEYAENVVLFDCAREAEFAPIKNGYGAPTDSPDTAKALLLARHRAWAEKAGIRLQGVGDFEILPETSYDGEGLERFEGQTFTLPCAI
jgi:UDP-N-acetylglucosamine pyrophosphorylase